MLCDCRLGELEPLYIWLEPLTTITKMLKSGVELVPKDFLCTICKQYLSTAPIYLLEDGRDICNSCSQGNCLKPYRNATLEKILANVHFPCKNSGDGCTVTYKFNKEEHINKCNYNPVPCPLHNKFKCQWNGKFKEMREHLTQEHRLSILKSATFDIHVDQDAEDAFMVLNGECFFLVNYMYDSAVGTFKYIIVTFDLELNSKIKLENSSNRDNVLQLTGHECVSLNSCLLIDYAFQRKLLTYMR
uniref:SIAH-type domain-containing protein n=1 Tax=Photinus pyralis TaxID=7054 RepID=A0A1Y1KVB1_PHOPY